MAPFLNSLTGETLFLGAFTGEICLSACWTGEMLFLASTTGKLLFLATGETLLASVAGALTVLFLASPVGEEFFSLSMTGEGLFLAFLTKETLCFESSMVEELFLATGDVVFLAALTGEEILTEETFFGSLGGEGPFVASPAVEDLLLLELFTEEILFLASMTGERHFSEPLAREMLLAASLRDGRVLASWSGEPVFLVGESLFLGAPLAKGVIFPASVVEEVLTGVLETLEGEMLLLDLVSSVPLPSCGERLLVFLGLGRTGEVMLSVLLAPLTGEITELDFESFAREVSWMSDGGRGFTGNVAPALFPGWREKHIIIKGVSQQMF